MSANGNVVVFAKISYSLPEAAEATGYSLTTIRDAIARGELVVHYRTSKPSILAEDLHEWVKSAPTERRSA